MRTALRFLVLMLTCSAALAAGAPVLHVTQTITPNVTACFQSQSPSNQIYMDSTGKTYVCDVGTGKFQSRDIPFCNANPPTGPSPAGAVCKLSNAASLYGDNGAGTWTLMTGSGATPSGGDGDVQVKSGAGLGTAPGFTTDTSSGAVLARRINGTVEVSRYASSGTGTTGDPWVSASGTGGISEAAATCPATGCTLHLAPGYYKMTAMATLGKGVRIEGDSTLASVIRADAAFAGTAILRWINPVSDNTFAGTIEQGIGGSNFMVDAAGVAAHGINVFKGYDYVVFDNVAVIDVANAFNGFRFEPNTAFISSLVSQTILLSNLYSIHKNSGATAPVYYFAHVQEMTLVNVKGFGGYVAGAGNCDVFYFLNCRGVTMIGGAAAISQQAGIHIASDAAGASQGLAFYGVTLEAVTPAVKVVGTTNSVQGLTFSGIRKQEATVTPPITTGGFTFARAVRVNADIPTFTATVDANSSDVRLGLSEVDDLTSDAGVGTRVTAQRFTAKGFSAQSLRGSLGLFPNDNAGPEIRFGHYARADYWRQFWSAAAASQFGLQLRYVDSAGVSKLAAIYDENGNITFYNGGQQALAMVGTRNSPTILNIPHGTTPPASCNSGDVFYDTDATVGQQHLICNTGNAFVVQGDGGGAFKVDTVTVTNPNLADGAKVSVSASGSNITHTIVPESLTGGVGGDLSLSDTILLSQVAQFASATLRGRVTNPSGNGLAVFNQGPTLEAPIINGFAGSKCVRTDSTGQLVTASDDCPNGGGGTVSSVGVVVPTAELTSSGGPISSSGNITLSWNAQSANRFFAGPASGASTTPTFRFLAPADCATAAFPGTAGIAGCVPAPTSGDISAGDFLKADGSWSPPPGGLATTGTPLVTQIARFGTGVPSTSINGLASTTLDDSGNMIATSYTSSRKADGSNKFTLYGNGTTDPGDPPNTDAFFFAKGALGVQYPFWRNTTDDVSQILTTKGGDYGCLICTGGSCVFDVNCVDGTMMQITGEAAGNVLYFDNGTSSWKPLANGSAGTVLQSNGVGSNPTWGAVSGAATRSMYFDAGSFTSDGTGCTTPAEVTLQATGPKTWTQQCPTDAATSIFYGKTVMPDGWDGANTITFELAAENENAAPSGTFIVTFSAMCRTPGTDTVGTTWGTGQTATITFATQYRTETATTAAVTPNGSACSAGDILFWRGISNTGTTTQEANVYILGVKMEYASTGSD